MAATRLVGRNVKNYRVGDAVFGLAEERFGTYAQYLCFSQDWKGAALAGIASFSRCLKSLTRNGILLHAVAAPAVTLRMKWTALTSGKKWSVAARMRIPRI